MAYRISLTLQHVTILNIRAEAAALPALSDHLQSGYSQKLPPETGVATHSQHSQVVCISPDHWLLVSEETGLEQRVSQFRQALNSYHANATLVTDQYACYLIEGSDVRDVLCQGCSINLEQDVFHYGHAAACAFTRSKIVLIPQETANQYMVLIESSLADYFEKWVQSSSGNS